VYAELVLYTTFVECCSYALLRDDRKWRESKKQCALCRVSFTCATVTVATRTTTTAAAAVACKQVAVSYYFVSLSVATSPVVVAVPASAVVAIATALRAMFSTGAGKSGADALR
jgi:hypothetical protein